jgi:hypothetical protein
MALLEAVVDGHTHVVELQGELARVRGALDRTDAVLTVADRTLTQAEHAIEESRHIAPYIAGAFALVVASGIVFAIWRTRINRAEPEVILEESE